MKNVIKFVASMLFTAGIFLAGAYHNERGWVKTFEAQKIEAEKLQSSQPAPTVKNFVPVTYGLGEYENSDMVMNGLERLYKVDCFEKIVAESYLLLQKYGVKKK